uniref:Uncharacterized protein n=1 Tax=Ditylenchus dipsaci TaxID=166011 RepID=A0A915E664_9BILA
MRIAIDQDEDGNFYIPPERFTEFAGSYAQVENYRVLCCMGGGSGRLAAFASEDNTPNEPPIRIYPAAGNKFKVVPAKYTGGHKISPTSGPVPVMEEIAKVQPGSKKASPSASPSADDLLFTGNNDSQPLLKR